MSDTFVPVVSGRAWAFADDLAATDILPLRHASLAANAAAAHLFGDLDAGLAAAIAPGDILVAGQFTGRGAGGAQAARALAAAGLQYVVVRSFGDAFDDHLLAAGIAPLEVDAPAIFHTGQRMRVNVEAGTIANLSSGDRQPIRNVTDALLERLRAILGR